MNQLNVHEYAITIEFTLRGIVNCERGGLAGLIDADKIEFNWYPSIAIALGVKYATADEEVRGKIEKFITDFGYYLDIGLSELLGFESSEKSINGNSKSIEYDNGVKAVQTVIIALGELINK